MLEKLKTKWKISGGRLALVIFTFAVGGSVCGWLARQILIWTNVEKSAFWILLYIIIACILWPVCVLVISMLTGQFLFFKNYLQRMGRRMSGNKMLRTPVNIAIFASGGGSNAKKLLSHFATHSSINVALICSNKANAGVLTIADSFGVPTLLILKEDFVEKKRILKALEAHNIHFIVLAGFLLKIPDFLIEAFPGKIINIHPALLPKYGGKGMYGAHVHHAVVAAGEHETGITIHEVDPVYDHGKIIFQKNCAIEPGDTAETVAARVLKLEHAHFSEIVEKWISRKNDMVKK